MVDVYFYEAFEEEAETLRRLMPPHIRAEYTDCTIQETSHLTPPAAVISIRTQSIIPQSWAPPLKAVLSRSTGYDHLLAYAAAVEKAPQLGYLPLYCHRAVAEQAMLMWMALLRRLPQQVRQFRGFQRDGITGGECMGRTLAVVGVGHIGHEAASIGRALGMRVLGVDIDPRHPDIEYVARDEALAAADVVLCAMNLTAMNRGYFDMAAWRRTKPGAVFVNVSRGELSPSVDLLAALSDGLLGGVGLDVYNHEPQLAVALRGGQASSDAEVLATLALAEREDVICTPHNAFNTFEAVERKSDHSVQQLVALCGSGRFLWPAPAV